MKRLTGKRPIGGDRYSEVFVPVEAVADRARSLDVYKAVLDVQRRLEPDAYTQYVVELYEQGLEVCGEHWRYLDLLCVLHASASMGRPENYLEIGVRRGRSACVVASACPDVRIYAADLWQEGYAGNENPGQAFVRRELAKIGHKGPLEFLEGDSGVTVPRLWDDYPELSFDLVTVDGDHSADGAWRDLVNVAPRVRVGGVLVFDDIANPYCPDLLEVWRRLVEFDGGLQSFEYDAMGTGVAFAIRRHVPPKPYTRSWRKKLF